MKSDRDLAKKKQERESEREKERHRERKESERETQREKEREKKRETQREKERERQKERRAYTESMQKENLLEEQDTGTEQHLLVHASWVACVKREVGDVSGALAGEAGQQVVACAAVLTRVLLTLIHVLVTQRTLVACTTQCTHV
jgi:flagellar biosynthesis GTPase FlhF